MIAISLPLELEEVLADLCRQTGQSAEQLALKALLERLEDFEDARVAEARLSDPSATFIPLDEVMRKFGLSPKDERQDKPAAE